MNTSARQRVGAVLTVTGTTSIAAVSYLMTAGGHPNAGTLTAVLLAGFLLGLVMVLARRT